MLAIVNQPPTFALVSFRPQFGSLFDVLHEEELVVDHMQAMQWAMDIARGMRYLHSLDPPQSPMLNYYLCSRHIVVDEDRRARISLFDYKFSFVQKGKIYEPAWMSPEALQKRASEINLEAAHIWSYAIILWELQTREVPFCDYSPMIVGLGIIEGSMRLPDVASMTRHSRRIISLCTADDPGRRPRFEQIIPIVERLYRLAKATTTTTATLSAPNLSGLGAPRSPKLVPYMTLKPKAAGERFGLAPTAALAPPSPIMERPTLNLSVTEELNTSATLTACEPFEAQEMEELEEEEDLEPVRVHLQPAAF